MVIFFAQSTIITHARPLQGSQANTKQNDQTHPVNDVEFQAGRPLDILTEPTAANTVNSESTSSTQAQQVDVTTTSAQGTIITQARPLQDTQANTKENAQDNPAKDVAEFQTATPLDKLTATTPAKNAVDPKSTSSTQAQLIDITATPTQDTIITHAHPLQDTQTNTKENTQTNPVKDAQINSSGGTQTSPLKAAEKFQTASPSDKLMATTKANTVDPVSTTSTQAQQIDVTGTSTTPKHGPFRENSKTVKFTLFVVHCILQLINLFVDRYT